MKAFSEFQKELIGDQQILYQQTKVKNFNSIILPLCTTSLNPWNPGHGSTSTPGLSTSLVSNIYIHSIGLPLVLGHVIVDPGHNVGPDGGPEHSGQAHCGAGAGVLLIIDSD